MGVVTILSEVLSAGRADRLRQLSRGTWLATRHADVRKILANTASLRAHLVFTDRTEASDIAPRFAVPNTTRAISFAQSTGDKSYRVFRTQKLRLSRMLVDQTTPDRAALRLQDVLAPLTGVIDPHKDLCSPFVFAVWQEVYGIPPEQMHRFYHRAAAIVDKAFDHRCIQHMAALEQDTDAFLHDLAQLLENAPDCNPDLKGFDAEAVASVAVFSLVPTTHFFTRLIAELARNEAMQEQIRQTPTLADRLSAECERLSPWPRLATRVVSEDISVQGTTLRKGDKVLCDLLAANRDPQVWPDGSVVRLDRAGASHLGFGAGPDSCTGAKATRKIARVFLEGILSTHRIHRAPGDDVTPIFPMLEHGAYGPVRLVPLA